MAINEKELIGILQKGIYPEGPVITAFHRDHKKKMDTWFSKLDPAKASGEEVGLALIYFMGLRDDEAMSIRVADLHLDGTGLYAPIPIVEVNPHGDCDYAVGGTNMEERVCAGEGPRSRIFPICERLKRFLEKRIHRIDALIKSGKLELPEGMTRAELPLACKGRNYAEPTTVAELIAQGYKLLNQIGIEDKDSIRYIEMMVQRRQEETPELGETGPFSYICRKSLVAAFNYRSVDRMTAEHILGIPREYVLEAPSIPHMKYMHLTINAVFSKQK